MKKFRFALVAATAALFALPAMAGKIPLSQISSYFNSFTTAEGEFTQVNADGTISTGTMFMKRPGRVRFEYAPPDDALVMAGGGQVAVFDPKSNQPPEQYPLKRTPLNLILERNVDLSRAKMVVGHTSDGNTTTVMAQDPEHPEYGNIQLVFSDSPVQLRQWIITDDSGSATTVILGDLETGVQLSARMFNIVQETEARTGN
ncbi:LolA family protein [Actibacterium lipolyticum]|uniref:Outer-membrane lipoprotein carrier protein n=1 Tax=Actibacterium lipolyticum TaxID=1524263 RepID=A0A238KU04_9RHOB|nr:outer membrane lipoprotein carrier protein LolA [Actibacterium lipolyticum]SMX46313.1 Outer-membrane lipoprotein carrier protein precursor [Actibacterium lipolyticum]